MRSMGGAGAGVGDKAGASIGHWGGIRKMGNFGWTVGSKRTSDAMAGWEREERIIITVHEWVYLSARQFLVVVSVGRKGREKVGVGASKQTRCKARSVESGMGMG